MSSKRRKRVKPGPRPANRAPVQERPSPNPLLCLPDETEWGEWLRRDMVRRFGLCRQGALVRPAQEVVSRLNRAREPAVPLELVCLGTNEPNAFIGPGRCFYMSRGLLQRIEQADEIALIAAHEMAHHDLGHTRLFHERLAPLREIPGVLIPAMILKLVAHFLNSPENEAAADARGLDLCLAAGFDGAACLRVFDRLEDWCLQMGARDVVFGPEGAREYPEGDFQRCVEAVRTWTWERARGYPPVRVRRAALLTRLEEHIAREELLAPGPCRRLSL